MFVFLGDFAIYKALKWNFIITLNIFNGTFIIRTAYHRFASLYIQICLELCLAEISFAIGGGFLCTSDFTWYCGCLYKLGDSSIRHDKIRIRNSHDMCNVMFILFPMVKGIFWFCFFCICPTMLAHSFHLLVYILLHWLQIIIIVLIYYLSGNMALEKRTVKEMERQIEKVEERKTVSLIWEACWESKINISWLANS